MNKSVEIKDLFDCKTDYLKNLFSDCKYPWEILPNVKDYVYMLIEKGIEGFEMISDGVYVGKNVKIYPTAVIEPPAIIGEGTEVRPGAFIRGSVITGANCVIGNSSELKNCVLLENVQVPHYNYVGDSILGNKAHMGAGSVCSNLKADGKNVFVHADVEFNTEQRKVGAFLADGADIGCGCVLNPGTVVGKNTSVYPLTPLRGVYPANCIVKSQNDITERK